jgi:chromosome segregation ATPase
VLGVGASRESAIRHTATTVGRSPIDARRSRRRRARVGGRARATKRGTRGRDDAENDASLARRRRREKRDDMLERLQRELDAAERRLASERRAEEASAARLAETTRDVERRRIERDDAKAARDEAMAALAEAREELDALERAKRAEDEAMVEVMKMMDERRARDDDARRRRLDETRAAIEFEFDARAIFREHRTSLELSDEIYERSKGLEGVGPWRDFDLGDVPDDLVETIARVVDARRENDAIRDELLAKGADANYAAFRDELERMRASDRPGSDV